MFNPLRSAGGERSATHLGVLADEELMQLVYRGNAAAFEVVYDRHADAAYSLALRMCGQRSLAEDVVQEAFLSVWRSGARYDRNRGSVRTWTLGIVHNRAIDALRRRAVRDRGRRRRTRGSRSVCPRASAPSSSSPAATRRARSGRLCSSYRAEQSHVIELAYFGGLTHVEIASMLDTPIGTVKGRMRLGLEKMRSRSANQER